MKKSLFYAVFIWSILALHYSSIASQITKENNYLTLKEVVKSAIKHYPIILSSYDKINVAESNLLASKGFFDITLKQNYFDRSRGYYDGKSYDTEIEKNLGFLGSRVYSGYRKSYGSFPDYEGESLTNSRGEFKAGVKLSLLKDRDIDQSRLSLMLSGLDVKEAKVELENIKMEIARDATKAYWFWVSEGKILKIYEDLYKLSLDRQNQLELRSKKGDIAQIIAVENRKNLLKRKTALAKIRQDFEASALYLSLFWRDETGKPIKPQINKLPDIEFELPKLPSDNEFKTNLNQALLKRPEIKIIEIALDKESKQLKYSKNLLKPKLDVEFEASKDDGSGPISRSQSNNYAGVNFSLPLQQREGKGKVAASNSKISALKYEQDLLKDQIKVEIDQITIKILTIFETYSLLTEEAKLAETLQKAEVEKFKHGASNFFLVNLREQDLAASKASVIEVFKELQNLMADYRLAIFENADNH